MMAILKAIHALGRLVNNKALQIVTDNISAMANINHMGGQSPKLTLTRRFTAFVSKNWRCLPSRSLKVDS